MTKNSIHFFFWRGKLCDTPLRVSESIEEVEEEKEEYVVDDEGGKRLNFKLKFNPTNQLKRGS